MEYKGYSARVAYDDEARVFHGEVLDLRDTITFEADNVDDLVRHFHESVEDYLTFCAERGEDPEKPYSGKFIVRLEPELHKRIAIQAKLKGRSLNAWVTEALMLAATDEK